MCHINVAPSGVWLRQDHSPKWITETKCKVHNRLDPAFALSWSKDDTIDVVGVDKTKPTICCWYLFTVVIIRSKVSEVSCWYRTEEIQIYGSSWKIMKVTGALWFQSVSTIATMLLNGSTLELFVSFSWCCTWNLCHQFYNRVLSAMDETTCCQEWQWMPNSTVRLMMTCIQLSIDCKTNYSATI